LSTNAIDFIKVSFKIGHISQPDAGRCGHLNFMEPNWIDSFREKLNQHYAWPSLYVFKFIVPTGKEEEVKQLFPLHATLEKSSKQGNYKSVTAEMMMPSGDAVLDIYIKASKIEGIVAL
jgi:uncharacterized protein